MAGHTAGVHWHAELPVHSPSVQVYETPFMLSHCAAGAPAQWYPEAQTAQHCPMVCGGEQIELPQLPQIWCGAGGDSGHSRRHCSGDCPPTTCQSPLFTPGTFLQMYLTSRDGIPPAEMYPS